MAEQSFKSSKIGFIGGGNIAVAIYTGLMRKDILNPNNIWISTRTKRMYEFWNKMGVHFTLKNIDVMNNCDIIFLTMKPNMLDSALSSIIENISEKKFQNKLFISVLVGISLDVLYSKLSEIVISPKIIRSMVNTSIMIEEGIIVYCDKNVIPKELELINTLFSHIGISESVPENLMNAVSGLSGSGPAFVYPIIEALADGGVKMGIPRALATKFAAQVLVGAGKMVLETERHPGQLKDEVCSPGGTSIAGVHVIEMAGVRASMINAVEAAVNKTNELVSKLN